MSQLSINELTSRLQQSQQREESLRQVLAGARCILWEAVAQEQKNGTFSWRLRILSSEALRKEFGLSPAAQDDDGAMWMERISPEEAKRMHAVSERALKNRLPGYQQEFWVLDAAGRRRCMREEVRIKQLEPEEFFLAGVQVEITALKETETELARERDLLHTLMNNIPDQIYFKDAESRFLKVNASVASVLGIKSPEEATGKSDFDYFRKQDAAAFKADDLSVMKTGKPLLDRVEHAVVKGVETWMSTSKAPILDNQGKAIGIVGISRDITDRKRTEEVLQGVVRHARCILWDARVVLENNEFTWQLKVLSSADIGRELGIKIKKGNFTLFDQIPREQLEKMNQTSSEALRGDSKGYQQEFSYIATDDSIRWLKENVQINRLSETEWNLVGVALDITERKQMEGKLAEVNEQLAKLAREDELTGLYNRRVILELTDHEWARWRRFGKAFSLMVIDADDFKSVNDRFGHRTGDTVLRVLATRLKESIRVVDSLGRYGGEEFVILLPETTLEGAQAVGEKIVQHVRGTPVYAECEKLSLTVSIGVVMAVPEDKDVSALIHRADMALYQAKNSGKNRVVSI